MPLAPNEETMKKRLGNLNSTQESVQTCSKWLLHHRDSIDKVANCWMEVYKTGNDKLKTSLIYVLNDVVQKAAGKRDINVTFTFHPHLINAIAISSPSVKKSISRCVEVFEQRSVYPPHIIDEIKTALITRIKTEKTEEMQNTGEIDYPNLVRSIESFYKNELLTEKAREILGRSSFNFKESVQARVKDRNEGVKALADMDASRAKMLTFQESIQKHQRNGQKLLEMIKQAQSAFNLQLRDVTVVNDAYEKFAEGIRETKQQLEAMDVSGILIGESPPRDAPSPTANDDPFVHGVDGEELAGGGDDMEMDEEDKPSTSAQCFLKPQKEYVPTIPSNSAEIDSRFQRTSTSSQQMGIGLPQQNNGPARAAAVMDPRQARFFSQQQPAVGQIPFPTPQMNIMNVPPPGLSPPPMQKQESAPGATPDQQHHFFNVPPPTIAQNGTVMAKPELSPPIVFDPTNPPPNFPNPSMMSSPPPTLFNQQLSPSPAQNFSIPPPGLIHPPPLFSQQPNRFNAHRVAGSIGGSNSKRRNSMAGENDGYRSKRGRNDSNGRNGQGHWEPKEGSWRRSFAGGEAGQYRH